MRFIVPIVVVSVAALVVLFSCQKYHDPAPITDPRLTNPYCNDPLAVNYNWGFPGRPDDSICFYPTDVFHGKYVFIDSVLQDDNTFAFSKVDTLNMYALSSTQLGVLGFCSAGDTLKMTATRAFGSYVDTTEVTGQQFCRTQDTVSGTINRDPFDTTLYHVYFTVVADTGTTFHTGSATKL